LPIAEAGAAAGILGHDLVLAGGTTWKSGKKIVLRNVQIYSVPENRWREGPPLPTPNAEAAFLTSSAGLEVLGGYDGENSSRKWWRLDASKAAWTDAGEIPEPRLFGSADQIDGTVFLAGGSPDSDILHSTDTLFSLERNSTASGWKKLAPVPGGGRSLHGSAVADGRLYLFGGCYGAANGDVVNRADAYSYQPSTRHWRRLRDLPRALRMATAVAVNDRFIYILGGYFATPEQTRREPAEFGFSSAVLVYDIEHDRYTASDDLPVAVAGAPFFLYRKALYGAGGEDRNYGRSARLIIGM
jgi:N-acetylneuraminic acid mutarotase